MRIANVRRWAAARSYGSWLLTVDVQSALDDIEGALKTGRHATAAIAARDAVHICLAVRGLLDRSAENLVPPDMGESNFDPFDGLAPNIVAEAVGLAQEILDIADASAAKAWHGRLCAYAQETETLLCLPAPLPRSKTSGGNFGIMKLARTWDGLARQFGCPSPVPKTWVSEPISK